MQNNPMKSKISRLRDSAGRCLKQVVRLCVWWPRNDTTRRYAFPWWRILWRAPFIAASIVVLCTAAVVCGLLTLAYNPSRALEIFDRIRSA